MKKIAAFMFVLAMTLVFSRPAECTYRRSIFIRRIQRGTITVAVHSASNTAALPFPVDTNNSVVLFGGYSGDQRLGVLTGMRYTPFSLELIGATTVRASRAAPIPTNNDVGGAIFADHFDINIPFQVIEFYRSALAQPVQRGTLAITAGNTLATGGINTVKLTRALVCFAGFTTDNNNVWNTSNQARWKPYIELIANTVAVRITTAPDVNFIFPYQVVEFK